MPEYRYKFQDSSDYPALERLALRLNDPRFSTWPLAVQWAKKLPGAPDDDFPVRRRRLLLYEGEEIRAFQNFFEHELHLDGKPYNFVWFTGQLSESFVNSQYALCWLNLLKHSLKLQPLHMSFADAENVVLQMLKKLKWLHIKSLIHQFILPINVNKVLRKSSLFGRSRKRRLAASILANSGIARLFIFTRSGWKRLFKLDKQIKVEEVNSFGVWADEVWLDNVGRYGAVTRRDAATLNRLYKPGDTRFHRLRIKRNSRDIGWIMYTTKFRIDLDLGFGHLKACALIDGFSAPEDAYYVMRAAVEKLIDKGVDCIFGYWSHRSWKKSARRLGFFQRAGDDFFISPAGKNIYAAISRDPEDIHITSGDQDGPVYVAYDPDTEARIAAIRQAISKGK